MAAPPCDGPVQGDLPTVLVTEAVGAKPRGYDIEAASKVHSKVSPRSVKGKLCFIVFLHITGAAMLNQIYPRISLEYYHGDNGKASTFNGVVGGAESFIQLFALPALSTASDIFGRRSILILALGSHVVLALSLSTSASSLYLMTVCQLGGAFTMVTLPMASAIIADVCSAQGTAAMAQGFGLVMAMFGLGLIVGPIAGGYLSRDYRTLGCLIVGAIDLLALMFMVFFAWEETLPYLQTRRKDRPTRMAVLKSKGGWGAINPWHMLKMFFEDRVLVHLATCYAFFQLAGMAYVVLYNLVNYRYGWGPEITGLFFAFFGLSVAVTQAVLMPLLVPRVVSEHRAIFMGATLQMLHAIGYSVATRGWMLFPLTMGGALHTVAEPCIQALMAKRIGPARQGSLQGALSSLRTLVSGVASPSYGYLLSVGISRSTRKNLGTDLPGLPYMVSAAFSACAVAVAHHILKKHQEQFPATHADSEVQGLIAPHERQASSAASDGQLAGRGSIDSPDLDPNGAGPPPLQKGRRRGDQLSESLLRNAPSSSAPTIQTQV